MPSAKRNLPGKLALLAAATIAIVACGRMPDEQLSPPGDAFPKLAAEGWVNGPALTPSEIDGHVLVVDFWAYWCGPCRASIPGLIEVYDAYSPQGVLFLGLTPESSDSLEDSRAFVRDLNVPWPNAYGAGGMMQKLGVVTIPSLFVVDRRGRIVWHKNRPGTLVEAIDMALSSD